MIQSENEKRIQSRLPWLNSALKTSGVGASKNPFMKPPQPFPTLLQEVSNRLGLDQTSFGAVEQLGIHPAEAAESCKVVPAKLPQPGLDIGSGVL